MKQIEALAAIESLGHPFFETKDVGAVLGVDGGHANKIASRLAKEGFIVRLARGRWALPRRLNQRAVAQPLPAPSPPSPGSRTSTRLIAQAPTSWTKHWAWRRKLCSASKSPTATGSVS